MDIYASHILLAYHKKDKTADLIKMSVVEGVPIVTLTEQRIQQIKNQANAMGLDIPKPINIDEEKCQSAPYLFENLSRDLIALGIKTAILDDEVVHMNCPTIIWLWRNGALLQRSC